MGSDSSSALLSAVSRQSPGNRAAHRVSDANPPAEIPSHDRHRGSRPGNGRASFPGCSRQIRCRQTWTNWSDWACKNIAADALALHNSHTAACYRISLSVADKANKRSLQGEDKHDDSIDHVFVMFRTYHRVHWDYGVRDRIELMCSRATKLDRGWGQGNKAGDNEG